MFTPGRYHATKEDLKLIPLERPERAKGFWKGIPHDELVHTFEIGILRAGITIHATGWKYAVSRDKADVSASVNIEIPGVSKIARGYENSIGIASSNAQRRRVTLFLGVSNGEHGIPLAGQQLARLTIRFDLASEIRWAFEKWFPLAMLEAERIVRDTKHCKVQDAEKTLIEACRRGWLPYSALKEFEPSRSLSGWHLIEQFSELVARCNATTQMDRTLEFTHFVQSEIQKNFPNPTGIHTEVA